MAKTDVLLSQHCPADDKAPSLGGSDHHGIRLSSLGRLPSDQRRAKVYRMEAEFEGIAEDLGRTWRSLTGGELIVVLGDEFSEIEVGGVKVPEDLRRSLEAGEMQAAIAIGSIGWWFASTRIGEGQRLSLVARATPGGAWQPVLRSWVELLSLIAVERDATGKVVEELALAWDRLTFLYELAKIASRYSELNAMLTSTVHLLEEEVKAGEVFLVVKQGDTWESVTSSGRAIPNPDVLVDHVIESPKPMGKAELVPLLGEADPAWFQVKDLLVARLPPDTGLRGVIGLHDPPSGRFDAGDAQLLVSVADQVGRLIEAGRIRSVQQDRQRLERELAYAAEIQASLLPASLPEIPWLELTAYLCPARQIGGDFYDVAHAKTGETMVMLGDVAGKGMPASILAALVHATFHSEAPHHRDPAKLLAVVNRLIYPDLIKSNTFVTAVLVRIDDDPLGFSYASAGHMELAFWRYAESRVFFLPATGLPLGIEPDLEYRSEFQPLEPGDVLLMYTDGVTEVEDVRGKVLGVQGLSDIIYAVHPAEVQDQLHAILQGLDVHRGDEHLKDDVALLLARVLPDERRFTKVKPFVVPADTAILGDLIDMAREEGGRLVRAAGGFGGYLVDEFATAFSEVVTNQIQHAYGGRGGRIQGRITVGVDRIVVDLYDSGEAFQSPAGEPVFSLEDPPERGYGLRLIRGLLDEVAYERLEGGRNHWRLMKRLIGDETC